jgi:hypothetical protein
MNKLSRSGIIQGNPRCHVLKFRIIEPTYQKLIKIQEQENICMALLIRNLLYRGLAEFVELSEEERRE